MNVGVTEALTDKPCVAPAEAEFSCTMQACLVLVSSWASSASGREGSESMRQRSRLFLDVLIDRIVGMRSFCMQVEGLQVRIEGGSVVLAPWAVEWKCMGKSPAFRGASISVVDCLIAMSRFQSKASRVGPALRDESARFLRSLVAGLALVFEYKCPPSPDDSFMSLPVLKLGSSKCRRISMGFKIDLRKSASSTPGVCNASQLVASDYTLKRKRNESTEGLASIRASKRFSRDHMYQYMLSSRVVFSPAGHVNVICDGARVNDDDLVSFLFFEPHQQVAAWGPPQAPHGGRQNTPIPVMKNVGYRMGVRFAADFRASWARLVENLLVPPRKENLVTDWRHV